MDLVEVVDFRSAAGTAYRLIRLDNPSRANCLSFHMLDSLQHSIEEADVETVLLASRGRVFCSGLDLDEIAASGTPEAHLIKLRDLLYTIAQQRANTLSIVSGSVVAGGIALACCTDITLAETSAAFSAPTHEAYLPLVGVMKALVLAFRPRADLGPLSERRVRACEAATLADETFREGDADPMDIAIELAARSDVPKRRIQMSQRENIDRAIADATEPDAIDAFLEALSRRRG